jgi:transposase, IS6 family
MSTPVFKLRHFLPEMILQAVRWDCRYALSYRDIKELMAECGVVLLDRAGLEPNC